MTKAEIAKIVEQEKIIAIVRGVEPQKCIDVAKALYDGGIRMMEITFNAKDSAGDPDTAACIGASGDTELFEKASNINGFQGGRVANNLYISPFRATVFKTAALFLYLNSSVVIRVRKPLFFPP